MPDKAEDRPVWDAEAYDRSRSQLLKLKSGLPREGFESLAKEVIKRVAEREVANPIESPSRDQVEHLCHALLCDEEKAGARFVEDAQLAGASFESVHLDYLAEAARLLGEWWDDDLVSFAEVTLGTSRMYGIMRAVRPSPAVRHKSEVSTYTEEQPSACFASVPGETHTLGLRMAAELFEDDGWNIDLKIGSTHNELVDEIRRSGRRLVGLSVAGLHSISALSQLVLALRIENPELRIFVGGNGIECDRKSIALLGVDAMASDIRSAKHFMRKLWASL